MSEMQEFLEWCALRGHYVVQPLYENYIKYVSTFVKEVQKRAETKQLDGDN